MVCRIQPRYAPAVPVSGLSASAGRRLETTCCDPQAGHKSVTARPARGSTSHGSSEADIELPEVGRRSGAGVDPTRLSGAPVLITTFKGNDPPFELRYN